MEVVAPKIALIDTNNEFRKGLESTLNAVGFDVNVSTASGTNGLASIAEHKPDVIVTELVLPGVDGIRIIEKVSKMGWSYHPIILVLSHLHEENLIKEVLDAGADYYLIKPVSSNVIIKRLHMLLAIDRKARESILNSRIKNILSDKTTDDMLEEKKIEDYPTIELSNGLLILNEIYTGILENDITNLLHRLGIIHTMGFNYLRKGIELVMNNPSTYRYATKELYPDIAIFFKTKSTSVERCSRHSIEVMMKNGDPEEIGEILFGNKNERKKPTVFEFVNIIADRISFIYRVHSSSCKMIERR